MVPCGGGIPKFGEGFKKRIPKYSSRLESSGSGSGSGSPLFYLVRLRPAPCGLRLGFRRVLQLDFTVRAGPVFRFVFPSLGCQAAHFSGRVVMSGIMLFRLGRCTKRYSRSHESWLACCLA